jgi:hypothetical protein
VRHILALGCSLSVSVSIAACAPRLPEGEATGGGGGPPEVELTIVPDAPASAAPPVLWLRLEGAARAAADDDPVLVRGTLGKASLEDLANGSPSDSLKERMIAATIVRDGDDVLLLPDAELEDGAHTVGLGALGASWPLVVTRGEAAVLDRVWPPHGRSSSTALAIFCGAAALPPIDQAATLAPDGPAGRLVRGSPLGAARSCIRFAPDAASSSGSAQSLHAPPAIDAGSGRIYLDPAPFALSPGEPEPIDVVACEEGEVAFGPGCARVMDDRLRVRAPEAPVFWAVSGEGVDRALTTTDGAAFTVRGLVPDSEVMLTVEVVGASGAFGGARHTIHTTPPLSHVVITEVYADAVGPEPSSEWVEIQNDGLAPAELSGMVLVDIGGETVLPEAVLAPGQIALVVGDDFVGDGEYDVAPAPGTMLVHVPRVGKNGLGNQGEPLKLVDATGAVVSRFPAMPKPKTGKSIARTSLDAEDSDAGAFYVSDPPTPGAGNVAQGGR